MLEVHFRLAETAYKKSHGEDYDQETTNIALGYYKNFINLFPESEKVEDIKRKVAELENRKSLGLLKSANFYYKSKQWRAALIYFKKIIDLYPNSRSADFAEKKIAILNKKLNKKQK